jgi:uncharacterized membrane protein YdbT with pleckstrin-like domain
MSYVKRVLQPGEAVRHTASLHWISYVPGLLAWLVAGVIAMVLPDPSVHWAAHRLGVIVAWLCFAVGLILIARAWFEWWITEIAVTDRRIIHKKGFIWRHTTEINMDKVESVEVDQSIPGRIFNYGDVYVRGTGVGLLGHLRRIAAPLEFRNSVIAV